MNRSQILHTLAIASSILLLIATAMSFTYPGPDRVLGEAQRLFYIHLGAFYAAFATFGAAVIAGVAFLRTGRVGWDYLGHACIETGLGLATITITTGSILANHLWGQYWTWDPRLTSVAVLWLTYAAYFFLRAGIEDAGRQRRFAAVYGVLAFGSVVLTMATIRLRSDLTGSAVIGPSVGGEWFGFSPRMARTLGINVVAYGLVAWTLVWLRVRLLARQAALQARKWRVLENA